MSQINSTFQKLVTAVSGITDKLSGLNITVSGKVSYDILDKFKQEIKQQIPGIVTGTTYTKQQILDKFATKEQLAATSGDIISQLSGIFRFKGSKTYKSELPTFGNVVGDVWHVKYDDTKTGTPEINSEFVWCDQNTWIELGSFIDLSKYATIIYVDTQISTTSGILKGFIDTNTENINILNNFKADKTYVDTVSGILDSFMYNTNDSINTLSTYKADKTYVDTVSGILNSFMGITNESINTLSTYKADLIYVNRELSKRPVDLTSFEVYATNYIIPSGINEELSGFVNVAIPSGMTHKMYIRTNSIKDSKQDVYIDWGDETITHLSAETEYELKEKDNTSDNVKPYRYLVSHTYNKPGFYDVTIYGKKYFGVYPLNSEYNIISRCMDSYHGFASHLKNAASFCLGAKKLLQIELPVYYNVWNVLNWSNCFRDCINLTSVKGFEQFIRHINTISHMFENCSNLQTCDLCCQENSACAATFKGCSKLVMPLVNFLPTRVGGFNRSNIDLTQTFVGCEKLTLSTNDSNEQIKATALKKIANVLWNDLTMNFTQPLSTVFKDCSETIRTQVPTSWGGTMELKSYPEQLQEKIDSLQ